MSKVLEAALPELAEIAGVQLDEVKDLKALLSHAAKKGSVTDTIVEIKKDLTEQFEALTASVAAMRNEYQATDAQRAQADLETTNLKTLFDNANPEEQKKIWESAAGKFGGAVAELALFGNNVEKMLYGKFAKGTEQHAVASKVREVSDLALTMTAINKGSQELSEKNFEIKRATFIEQIDRLEKYGIEGVDTYRKVTALDTLTANEGQDFIPNPDLSQSIIENIWLELRVAPLFNRLTMTTPTFEIPQITTRGRAYLMGESTEPSDFLSNQFTPDAFESSKMSFVARKLGAQIFWNDEIAEDAQVPLAQIILSKLSEMHAIAIEDAVINGNRTGWNSALDNAAVAKLWTSQRDSRYAWDGLRYGVATGQKVDAAGTVNLAMFRKARRVMGKYALKPGDLNWVFNPVTMADILGIDEVLRWRDIQDKATVMNGVLAEIDGIGIMFSEFIYDNLNASGVYDNLVTTKTMGLLHRRDSHLFGDRRLVRVESDRSVTGQQNVVVSTWRGDFKKKRTGMSTSEASVVYNLPS